MSYSTTRLSVTLLLLLLFTSNLYSNVISKDINNIDNMINNKELILQKTQKSHTTEYMSLYDEIVELTISKNDLLLKLDRVEDIDTDKTCDLAMKYAEVEFIKTQYYKTPFHEEVAKTMENIISLYEQCHPPMAEKYFKPITKIKEHIHTKESVEVAKAHDALGDYYRIYMANFKRAIKEYDEAKRIRVKLYGVNDSRITENYNVLAISIFYHASDTIKAESLVLEALKIIKSDANITKVRLSQAFLDTSYFYNWTGDYKKSLSYLHEAENILVKEGYENSIEMVSIYEGFKDVYTYMNDIKSSKKYGDKALSIKLQSMKLK